VKILRPTWLETSFLILCAGVLTWKLLLPGFIGLANNGDFGKVAGPLCISDADNGADNFVFFRSDYVRGPKYCYEPHVMSSEIGLAWLASSIEKIMTDPARFDIRWLGALHVLIFLGFYFSVLLLLRRLNTIARVILSLTALWIFADTGLIAYFNSFYTDAAAILGGLVAVILAVHLMTQSRASVSGLVAFGLAALLFVMSKGQHGLLVLVPAAFILVQGWRSFRIIACVIASVVLAGAMWVLITTPDWYRGQARFNLIFYNLALRSQTPLQDLRELGLNDSDSRYLGMHSFMPASPMNDPAWSHSFYARCTYGKVLKLYLHHPAKAVVKLWSDVCDEAWQRRPAYLSNYRREYGHPAGAKDQQLSSWSALRSWLFKWWPAHILIWLALAISLPLWFARSEKSRFRRSLAYTIPVVALLALAEFCSVSLADACETDRHLLMFHVFTDMTMFLALIYAAAPRTTDAAART
jgi:hypothetical protein